MNKEVKLKLWHVMIFITVFVLLLFFIIVTAVSPVNVGNYTEQEQKIDSLNNVISGLKGKQLELNESIAYQQNEIVFLNKQIDSTNIEIVKVKEYYGKKIYSWSHDKYDSGAELIVCKLAETNPAPFTTHIRVLVLNDGANGNDRQISEIPGRRWKNNYNYRNELIWRGSTSNLAPTDDESEVSSPEDATDYPDALGG